MPKVFEQCEHQYRDATSRLPPLVGAASRLMRHLLCFADLLLEVRRRRREQGEATAVATRRGGALFEATAAA